MNLSIHVSQATNGFIIVAEASNSTGEVNRKVSVAVNRGAVSQEVKALLLEYYKGLEGVEENG